jgi:beta-aspartyl-peptidase (threonine type)
MRFVILLAILAAPAHAAVQSAERCERGADIRLIEVHAPGEIGAACDLKYVRENGANVSVPYHADNNAAFCAERAVILAQSLAAAGFSCSSAARQEAQATPAAQAPPQTDPIAELAAAQGAAPAEAPVPQSAAPREAPAPQAKPAAVSSATPKLLQPPPKPEPASVAATAKAPGPSATGAPVPLTPASASLPARGPKVAATGRVVGAAPEATTVAAPAAAVTAMRPAEEIIRGVLSAQAAAWNAGDIEAFMGGYWNSPELTFVSGTRVTKGWAETLQRYREKYGTGASLGTLSFESLEVDFPTEDVAVVLGRFRLARPGAADSGAFTLVMKRFGGLWRIVHDHSASDPPTN